MRISAEKGTLLICDGVTHFPQERQTYRLFPGALDPPSRIIVVDGSGALAFDMMDWLSSQSIPLTRVGWRGEVVSVIGGANFAHDRERLEWRRATRDEPESRIKFASLLIAWRSRSRRPVPASGTAIQARGSVDALS